MECIAWLALDGMYLDEESEFLRKLFDVWWSVPPLIAIFTIDIDVVDEAEEEEVEAVGEGVLDGRMNNSDMNMLVLANMKKIDEKQN